MEYATVYITEEDASAELMMLTYDERICCCVVSN